MTAAPQPYIGRHSAPPPDEPGLPPADSVVPGPGTAEAEPAVGAALEPEPAAEPALEPEPAAEIGAEPAPEPAVAIAPQPDPQPDPEDAPEPDPQPVRRPALRPSLVVPPVAAPIAAPVTAAPPFVEPSVAVAPPSEPQDVPSVVFGPPPAPWAAPPSAAQPPAWTPAPPTPAKWDTPDGFVPLVAPTRRRLPRVPFAAVAALLAVVLAAGAFFVLHTMHHARPVAAAQTTQTANYTSVNGHFAAYFASPPTEHQNTAALSGYALTGYTATDQQCTVVAVAISPTIPADKMSDVLRGEASTFSTMQGADHSSVSTETFQGHPAMRVVVVGAKNMTVFLIGYSPSTNYVLLAPSGATFDKLLASFRPTA